MTTKETTREDIDKKVKDREVPVLENHDSSKLPIGKSKIRKDIAENTDWENFVFGVGFIPMEHTFNDNGRVVYKKCKLVEISLIKDRKVSIRRHNEGRDQAGADRQSQRGNDIKV